MVRRAWMCVLLACGPVDPPLVGEDPSSSSATGAMTVADGSSSSATGVSATTGEPGPISGEWIGQYDAGFGYAYFKPCGSEELWRIGGDFTGFEVCRQAPLWLHIVGTVEADPDYPGEKIVVVELFKGPCLTGGCESGPVDDCDTLEAFCLDGTGECNPVFQNCPEGQKCAPAPQGSAACVPVEMNPAGDGEPCMRDPQDFTDTCAADSLCQVSDVENGAGTCVPLCIGKFSEPVCEDPDQACLLADNAAYCLPRCDPRDHECSEKQTCLVHSFPGDVFVCFGGSNGGKLSGEDCDGQLDCADGLLCSSVVVPGCSLQAAGCCTAYCSVDGPPCEAPGTECVPWSEPIPELPDLGVCGLP